MFTNTQRILRALPALLIGASAAKCLGQRPGDLIITPTRIVLDERGKSSDLTLLNRGARPIRYRLSLVDMQMMEDGTMRRMDAASETSAISILKLSPREIVLDPGISQRIRIASFMPANQPDGEYRAHLVFEPISAPTALNNLAAGDGTQQLSINLSFRSVISIPVIVRHGRLAASATLSDASLNHTPAGWTAQFKIHRTGNRSLRGDVKVEFQPASGSKVDLGQISGLAVYVPNEDRVVTVKLTSDLAKLGPGKFFIRFNEPDRSRGASDVQMQVALPG
jgi:P pilus assembly chaperone PapD